MCSGAGSDHTPAGEMGAVPQCSGCSLITLHTPERLYLWGKCEHTFHERTDMDNP